MIEKELTIASDFPPVSYDKWRANVATDLKGVPFEKKLVHRSLEGFDIQPLYTANDWPSDRDSSGFPGFLRNSALTIFDPPVILNTMMKQIPRIVSGGQSGADRAALDWALSHNLPCGGWSPKGRKAEDGPINAKYPLKESSSGSYLQRTEWNVRDSDATILSRLLLL